MKKIILLSAISIVVLANISKAQDKAKPQDQPKKPVFQLNGNRPATVTFTLPIGFLESYLLVEQNGGLQAIENSDKLTGQQITYLKSAYKTVKDSINNQMIWSYNSAVLEEQKKFTADTTAKFRTKK